jgi:tetratricopeptide (TPR) repeat protein
LKRGARFYRLAPFIFSLIAASAVAQPSGDEVSSTALASERFAAGSAAFQSENYRRALTEFQAAIDAGSTGPAVHYNLAVCYYQLGEYARAEDAFRALGRDYPQMRGLADYNVGLSLVRRDRLSAARDAFERAARSEDDQLVILANAMLDRLAPELHNPPNPWIRLVDIQFGRDDNVALIDPLSLPAELTTASPFAELQLYVGGPLRAASAWRLDASAFLIEYPDADSFDQTGMYLSARHEQLVGRWQMFVRPQFGRTHLNGDGFEQYVGLSLALQQSLSSTRTTVGFEFSHDSVSEIDSRFGYIDGKRSMLGLRADRSFDRGRFIIDYRIQIDDRAGAGVSADRDRALLRYIRPLSSTWTGEIEHEYRVSDYNRLSTPRKESRHQSGFRATRELPSGWQIALRYRFTDNDSSDSTFSYRRNRVSFGVSKVF